MSEKQAFDLSLNLGNSMNESKIEPNMSSNGCQSFGIFWDIENCPIPGTERAANVVQSVCQFVWTQFGSRVGHKSEPCVFCCACDTRTLDQRHVEGLNRKGVDILHVNPVRVPFKVDADSKLKEGLQKFVDHHSNRCLVFLITGDIDFAPVIRSAKRRGFDVILMFGTNTSLDLKNSATDCHSFYEIINTFRTQEPEMSASTNSIASNYLPFPTNSRTTSISIANPLAPDSAKGEPMEVSNVGITSSQPSVVPVVTPVIGPIRLSPIRPESGDRSRSQNRNSDQSTVEFDPQKLRQVMEVTGVERHIALRMLQICNGSVELTINAIYSD